MKRLIILLGFASLLAGCSSDKGIQTSGGTWSDIKTGAGTTGMGAGGPGTATDRGTGDSGSTNSTNHTGMGD